MSMSGWFGRAGPAWDLLSDLKALLKLPLLWVYLPCFALKEQNTVLYKLSIIIYFNYWLSFKQSRQIH